MAGFSRRRAVLAACAAPLLWLESGCRASLPPWSAARSGPEAFSLLHESAVAHGLSAYGAISDLNVSYTGHWRRLVQHIQPVLVDPGFRGGSEERLLLRDGIIAQTHEGPQGRKHVVRTSTANGNERIRVWFNGAEAHDRDRTDAAALVAEAYALFLLGPLLLQVNQNPHRDIAASLAGSETLTQNKQTRLCDLLNLKITPGIGNSGSDQLALYIDRQSRLMRRVRMTLNGLESTRGALVDIDTFEHRSLHGVQWPTSFHERLLRPAPLDVHTWRLTGLDINRGESPADVDGAEFSDKARTPATPLTP